MNHKRKAVAAATALQKRAAPAMKRGSADIKSVGLAKEHSRSLQSNVIPLFDLVASIFYTQGKEPQSNPAGGRRITLRSLPPLIGMSRHARVGAQGHSFVARTSVFEVRGSSLAKAPNRQDGRLPSGLGARVEERAADLNGGGRHCNTVKSCFLNKKFSLPAPSCATGVPPVPEHGQVGRGTSLVAAPPRCATRSVVPPWAA
jgi:hypothetical protein